MEQDECYSFTFEAKTGSCWSKNQTDGDLKENKKGLISANKECFIMCPANQYKIDSEGSTSPSNCTSLSKLHLVNLLIYRNNIPNLLINLYHYICSFMNVIEWKTTGRFEVESPNHD